MFLIAISTFVGSDLVPLRKRGVIQGIGNLVFGVGCGLGGFFGGKGFILHALVISSSELAIAELFNSMYNYTIRQLQQSIDQKVIKSYYTDRKYDLHYQVHNAATKLPSILHLNIPFVQLID